MFHTKDGLFFARINSSDVRIIKTRDGKLPDTDPDLGNILFAVTLTESEWASAVASVSAAGEDHDQWMRARVLHGLTTADLNQAEARP